MKNEIKFLMDKLIEKFGGLFKRENQRTYWETPQGEKHHVNTVFLRRMTSQPTPVVKEQLNVVEQPKQKEVSVNGITVQRQGIQKQNVILVLSMNAE